MAGALVSADAAAAPIVLNTVPAGALPACPAACTQEMNVCRSPRSTHPAEDVQVL